MIFMAKTEHFQNESHQQNGLLNLFSEPVYKFIREIGFPIFVSILMFYFIWTSQNFIYELVKTEQIERQSLQKSIEKNNELLFQLVHKVDNLNR